MSGLNGEVGMLQGYRVLDLSGDIAYLAGKILGDLGADVIKVEPPEGDPGRSCGPFYGGSSDPERSLQWFAYNSNKRGITLSLESEAGREIFLNLVRGADFVFESFAPGYLDDLGLGYSALSREAPNLVMVSVTPFGQSGPYSGYAAGDLELMAMSGLMSVLGSPDREPVRSTLPQSYLWAGMSAAMGALTAHHSRGQAGRGQHVDVSAQAGTLWAMAPAPTFWDVLGQDVVRDGQFVTGRSVTGAKMRAIYRCEDGYLNFIIYGGAAGRATNRALVQWMQDAGFDPGYAGEVDWDSFDVTTVTQEEMDRIEGPVASFLRGRTKREFMREATERRMLGYPVATAEDILADEQLEARDFWQDVAHPELGTALRYPGGFAKLSSGFCGIRRPAPRIGEHNAEIYGGELGLAADELERLSRSGVI
ncbi:MAG: CaiB/BaiF CoA transferase family protein [Thermoleophilia bacterium]